jgi:hypothetical protein
MAYSLKPKAGAGFHQNSFTGYRLKFSSPVQIAMFSTMAWQTIKRSNGSR